MNGKHETASRPCIASNRSSICSYIAPQTSVLRTGPNAHSICRPILYVCEARNGLLSLYCQQCIGSMKRSLASVLPATWSEKLTNMPRRLRMDICIYSYQQLGPQTSVVRTGPNAHSICMPMYCVYGKDETASRPCMSSKRK